MDDQSELEYRVRSLVRNLLTVLLDNGISTVNVGGILRVLGVPNDVAQAHDLEYMEIANSESVLDEIEETIPVGTTLHWLHQQLSTALFM